MISNIKSLFGRCLLLGIIVFVFSLFTMPMAGKAMAADLELDDHQGQLEDQLIFTLSVNNAPNEVASLGLDIGYDQTVLEYVSADFTGTLMESWSFKQVSNPSPGILRLGGFTAGTPPPGLINPGDSGALVTITFDVIGADDCPLPLSELKDGIAGWTTKDGAFTYILPTVTSITPDKGSTLGGQPVTITGENFFEMTAVAGVNPVTPPTVSFGGEEATDVTVVSSAQITCTTPAHAEGVVDVVVTNPDGKAATLTDGYEYLEFGIEPSSATVCEGASIKFTVTPEGVGIALFTWKVDEEIVQQGESRTFEYMFMEAGEYIISVEDSSVPALTAQSTVTVLAEDDSGALDIMGGSGMSGDTVTIVVQIQNAPNQVASLGFDVTYDSNVLTYVEYARGALVQDFDFFDINLIEPGQLRIGGFEAYDDKIAAGASGTLIELTFTVDPDLLLDPDECICRFIEPEELKDDIGTWDTSWGCFLANCGCNGDVNGDGEITPLDALCAFETYLLIDPTTCGIPIDEVCCDVTRDGDCTPADALCIFNKYLMLPSCLD